jgi:integrase
MGAAFGATVRQPNDARLHDRHGQPVPHGPRGKVWPPHPEPHPLNGQRDFSYALNLEYVDANPWHGAKTLGKVRESAVTAHYTLEEAESIINALIDRTDAQLVFALAFFMGLRPSEIAALQWGDFDGQQIHIRRAACGAESMFARPRNLPRLCQ